MADVTLRLFALLLLYPRSHVKGQFSPGDTQDVNLAEGALCLTSHDAQGVCGLVTSCPPLMPYIHLIKMPQIYYFFSKNICGNSERGGVFICCPAVSYNPQQSAGRRPITETQDNTSNTITTQEESPSKLPYERECGAYDSRLRIIGGKPSKLGEWPWLVALGTPLGQVFDVICGGSLISHYFVLSAAHCFNPDPTVQNPTHARIGDYDLMSSSDGAKPMDYLLIAAFENNFVRKTFENDIILLKMERFVPFTDSIRPACLPFDLANADFTDERITLTGWGFTKPGTKSSPIPLEARTPVLPLKKCRKAYENTVFKVDERSICAGSGGVDSCTGDSGGPLNYVHPKTSKWTVIGITSFGIGCGNPDFPGVSINLSSYLSWIVRTVQAN